MENEGYTGGPKGHKSGCLCGVCVKRRRKEETLAERVGPETIDAPTEPTARRGSVLNADLPVLTASPHHSIRDRINQWLAIRATHPSLKDKEIAERIGVTANTLKSYIYKATKEGWLKFDNPIERLDNEIVPLAVDNLVHFLKEKDRTATLETAKGVLFPVYREQKGIHEVPQTILALKIENVPLEAQKAVTGMIVGKPRELKSKS